MKATIQVEPRTAAVIVGLSIGLGLVVHEAFFLVAAGVTAMAVAQAVRECRKTARTDP